MSKELDTIREVIESSFEYVGPAGGIDIAVGNIIAALSTIEPEAKPQEPSEDARDVAMTIMAHQEMWIKGKNFYTINDAAASIEAYATAHDDAIRRECAEGAVTLYEYWHGKTDRSDRLCAAILGKEAEK